MKPSLWLTGPARADHLARRRHLPHALEGVGRYLGYSSTVPKRRYAQQTPEAHGVRAASVLARAGLVAG
jgi:hypothetical protein